MAALPAHIPPAVKSSYDRLLNWHFGGHPESQACFVRLIERPCMKKVWHSLERHLTNPTAWEWVIDRAVFYSDHEEYLDQRVRPEQRKVTRKLEQIRKSGEELIAALDWLWGGENQHGHYAPDDWGYLEHILRAGRMGPEGKRLSDLLYDPSFPLESPCGKQLTQVRMSLGRYTVQHVIRAVVDMHSTWQPGSTGGEFEEVRYSRKTGDSGRAQLYVRLMARDLKEHCKNQPTIFPSPETLPYGRLLSHDDLARLTRAALDLPDEPPGFPHRTPFNAGDVRKALKSLPP